MEKKIKLAQDWLSGIGTFADGIKCLRMLHSNAPYVDLLERKGEDSSMELLRYELEQVVEVLSSIGEQKGVVVVEGDNKAATVKTVKKKSRG